MRYRFTFVLSFFHGNPSRPNTDMSRLNLTARGDYAIPNDLSACTCMHVHAHVRFAHPARARTHTHTNTHTQRHTHTHKDPCTYAEAQTAHGGIQAVFILGLNKSRCSTLRPRRTWPVHETSHINPFQTNLHCKNIHHLTHLRTRQTTELRL